MPYIFIAGWNFYCISEKDNEIYDAFNKGWKMTKGEWIYYLDAFTKQAIAGKIYREYLNVQRSRC